MSRQLHRSVIKEQLAPFWVDMCQCLLSAGVARCHSAIAAAGFRSARGAVSSGAAFLRLNFRQFLKRDARTKKKNGAIKRETFLKTWWRWMWNEFILTRHWFFTPFESGIGVWDFHTSFSENELWNSPVSSLFLSLTDNSISVVAKHDSFRRQKQEIYFLPIVVSDQGHPPMSSTNTLTIRVCGCSRDLVVQSCNVEAYVLPIGLSMGALIAILACIILLLGDLFLFL